MLLTIPSYAETNQQDILMPRDVFDLRHRRLVLPPTTEGTRLVHKGVFIAASNAKHGNVFPAVNGNYNVRNHSFVNIPTKLISLATVEYVGFTPLKAAKLWSLWTNSPFSNTALFINCSDCESLRIKIFFKLLTRPFDGPLNTWREDVARWKPCVEHTATHELQHQVILNFLYASSWSLVEDISPKCPVNTWSEDTQMWRFCMDYFGLHGALQERILHPMFRNLRSTKSCASLAKVAIETRFADLQLIQETSRRRADALYRASIIVPSRDCGQLTSVLN